MVAFSFSRLVAFCSAVAVLSLAAPAPDSTHRLQSDVHPFNHGGLRAASEAMKAKGVSPRGTAPTMFNHPGFKLDKTARDILARATPRAPHFVVYGDRFISGVTGPPSASQIQVMQSFNYLCNSWIQRDFFTLGIQRFVCTQLTGVFYTEYIIYSALAFLLTEGAFDKAAEWTQLSASQRSSVKSQSMRFPTFWWTCRYPPPAQMLGENQGATAGILGHNL